MRGAACLLLAALLCAQAAIADDGRLPLWRIDGKTNRVYLLGSVHLLRPSDYPLPAAVYAAYDDAETLVMELDMDDLDPAAAQAAAQELGTIGPGASLASLIGADAYERALALAAAVELPLELLAQAEPWLAAITIEQHALTRIGFTAAHGVESHFTERAAGDRKEILGLETIREQLEMLDGLPLPVQRDLLLQTLEESADLEAVMTRLIQAWKRGDIATLENTLLEDMRAQPVLYRDLVVTRNRNWVTQIEDLLQEPDDYLVIVGTLHLIGDDGVPAMLAGKGYRPQQLTQPR